MLGIIIGITIIGYGAYFVYTRHKKESVPTEYIWVGPGENPFK